MGVHWWHAMAHLARLNETNPQHSLGILALYGMCWQGILAERVGFEPTVRSPVHRISSAAHSTTLPPLHGANQGAAKGVPGRGSAPLAHGGGLAKRKTRAVRIALRMDTAFIRCALVCAAAKPYIGRHGPCELLFASGRTRHFGPPRFNGTFFYRRCRAPSRVRFPWRRFRYRPGLRQ